MSKPREIDVSLETREFVEWKSRARGVNETPPLDVMTFEKVRMIEKSFYDVLEARNKELGSELTLERQASQILSKALKYECCHPYLPSPDPIKCDACEALAAVAALRKARALVNTRRSLSDE